MIKITKGLILGVTLALAACGGGSGGDDNGDGDGNGSGNNGSVSVPTQIHEFKVIGNAPALPDGTPVIDPSINNGAFQIRWDVESIPLFFIWLYFSEDDVLNELGDGTGLIDGELNNYWNCSDDGSLFCGFQNTIQCDMNTDGYVRCDPFQYAVSKNLYLIPNEVPGDLYFILKVCDAYHYDCKYVPQKVHIL